MRETVWSLAFVTQTAPSPTAMPAGRRPTRMKSAASVAGSMRETVFALLLATHTELSSAAIAVGVSPTRIFFVT